MRPELIIGLVGPIGCNMDTVQAQIGDALKRVNYTTKPISISEGIATLWEEQHGKRPELASLEDKISTGNDIRRMYNNNGILAVYAMVKIRRLRQEIHRERGTAYPEDVDQAGMPTDGTAFIIRQFKRPEEIQLMRTTYKSAFIQISINQDRRSRLDHLIDQLKKQPQPDKDAIKDKAEALIRKDESEDDNDFGQRLTKIFHLADVFIDGNTETSTAERFIQAIFGRNNIAPTKDELGSYLAKSASLRSVDLSRQVGAAILSAAGDLITIGCNEVPKPGGGNYWDEDDAKKRDIDKGNEPNKNQINRIIYDFLGIFFEHGAIQGNRTPDQLLSDKQLSHAIHRSMIGEITEYGRIVHAEMNAISDAARLGRSITGATLYVTTFPCHNCAKHIIASGIARVVFIEPYPKSRTELLYGDLVSIHSAGTGKEKTDKVAFVHFSGIAPSRFLSIFEKSRRCNKDTGVIEDWYENQCRPRIGDQAMTYTDSEVHAISENLPLTP